MASRTAALLLLGAALLMAAGVDGFNDGRGRCLCPESGSSSVRQKLVKTIEVYPKTANCDRIEVIAEMKPSGRKSCLDWNSTKVKKLVKTFTEKRSHQKTQKNSKA